jgi:hypothetical protein
LPFQKAEPPRDYRIASLPDVDLVVVQGFDHFADGRFMDSGFGMRSG